MKRTTDTFQMAVAIRRQQTHRHPSDDEEIQSISINKY